MNRSSKFNFFLPQNTDPIEVSDFNNNFETIDANLLTKAQSLTEAQKAAVRANVGLNVANNISTTEAGYVLDARQASVLAKARIEINYGHTSSDDISSLASALIERMTAYGTYVFTGSWTNHSWGYTALCERSAYNDNNDSYFGTIMDNMGKAWTFIKRSTQNLVVSEFVINNSGIWTPNIQRATVSSVVGKYQKVGNLYICTFSFSLDAVQTNAPYLNGSSLPGYTTSVFTAADGSWSSAADEFGAMGNTNNNNIWFSKNNAIYGMSGSVNKTVRGTLTYIA